MMQPKNIYFEILHDVTQKAIYEADYPFASFNCKGNFVPRKQGWRENNELCLGDRVVDRFLFSSYFPYFLNEHLLFL